MHALSRWWMRRRHGAGEWGGLFAAAPAGEWVSLDLETTGMDPARDHILSLAAVPVRDGRRGNPVLWGSRYFPEMMELTGDFGAKPLMARHEAQLIEVEVVSDPVTLRGAVARFLAVLRQHRAPGELRVGLARLGRTA